MIKQKSTYQLLKIRTGSTSCGHDCQLLQQLQTAFEGCPPSVGGLPLQLPHPRAYLHVIVTLSNGSDTFSPGRLACRTIMADCLTCSIRGQCKGASWLDQQLLPLAISLGTMILLCDTVSTVVIWRLKIL